MDQFALLRKKSKAKFVKLQNIRNGERTEKSMWHPDDVVDDPITVDWSRWPDDANAFQNEPEIQNFDLSDDDELDYKLDDKQDDLEVLFVEPIQRAEPSVSVGTATNNKKPPKPRPKPKPKPRIDPPQQQPNKPRVSTSSEPLASSPNARLSTSGPLVVSNSPNARSSNSTNSGPLVVTSSPKVKPRVESHNNVMVGPTQPTSPTARSHPSTTYGRPNGNMSTSYESDPHASNMPSFDISPIHGPVKYNNYSSWPTPDTQSTYQNGNYQTSRSQPQPNGYGARSNGIVSNTPSFQQRNYYEPLQANTYSQSPTQHNYLTQPQSHAFQTTTPEYAQYRNTSFNSHSSNESGFSQPRYSTFGNFDNQARNTHSYPLEPTSPRGPVTTKKFPTPQPLRSNSKPVQSYKEALTAVIFFLIVLLVVVCVLSIPNVDYDEVEVGNSEEVYTNHQLHRAQGQPIRQQDHTWQQAYHVRPQGQQIRQQRIPH